MRVALISDLHGNALALDAVLRDIERRGTDRIVCLGDVATLGPQAGAVMARLAELACPCILGNHDEFLLRPELIVAYTQVPVIVDAIEACRAERTAAELEQLRGFAQDARIDLGSGASLALFHGSPRSNTEDLLATTPAPRLDEALGDTRGTVLAGGHTHLQMVRQHRGTWLLNPGSVGLPFESYMSGGPPRILPHAEYAQVESTASGVSVTLHRVDLDRRALRAQAAAWRHPLAAMLVAQYA